MKSKIVKYLIISSAFTICFSIASMFFKHDSSIFDMNMNDSFVLALQLIVLIVIYVNVVLTAIYIVFRVIKRFKKHQ